MTNYVKYQCSVCRRVKDIAQDNMRVQLSACIITKGCSGTLSAIDTTKEQQQTETVSGLVDWYPRGQEQGSNSAVNETSQPTLLSGSDTGIIFLAIKESDPLILNNTKVKLVLSQKRLDDISKQQYRFISDGSSILSGKDLTGKILRFNQLAIDEGRVYILINGVRDTAAILTHDTVNFAVGHVPSIGSNIEISVYNEKDSIIRKLDFTLNNSSALHGTAWGNIRYILDHNSDKWWIYSSVKVNELPQNARFKIESIVTESDVPLISNLANARFLLTSAPFESVDRYLNFYISVLALSQNYSLVTAKNIVTEMYSTASTSELFPVFKLAPSGVLPSYITPDVVSSTSSITTDTTAERLVGVKTIGPI